MTTNVKQRHQRRRGCWPSRHLETRTSTAGTFVIQASWANTDLFGTQTGIIMGAMWDKESKTKALLKPCHASPSTQTSSMQLPVSPSCKYPVPRQAQPSPIAGSLPSLTPAAAAAVHKHRQVIAVAHAENSPAVASTAASTHSSRIAKAGLPFLLSRNFRRGTCIALHVPRHPHWFPSADRLVNSKVALSSSARRSSAVNIPALSTALPR